MTRGRSRESPTHTLGDSGWLGPNHEVGVAAFQRSVRETVDGWRRRSGQSQVGAIDRRQDLLLIEDRPTVITYDGAGVMG
jgi:hypothetical protein